MKLLNAWKEDYDFGYYSLRGNLPPRLFLFDKKRKRARTGKALWYFSSSIDYDADYRDFVYYTRDDSVKGLKDCRHNCL